MNQQVPILRQLQDCKDLLTMDELRILEERLSLLKENFGNDALPSKVEDQIKEASENLRTYDQMIWRMGTIFCAASFAIAGIAFSQTQGWVRAAGLILAAGVYLLWMGLFHRLAALLWLTRRYIRALERLIGFSEQEFKFGSHRRPHIFYIGQFEVKNRHILWIFGILYILTLVGMAVRS